jgi:protoporphyrinogen/coproporphyrinogen III oxidase
LVIIIGAGISGLAAAHELVQRGVPFRVLEASARAGGLILTEQCGGFTIDAGADSMLATKPAARALCDEVGLSPRLQAMSEPRSAYVLSGTRLFPLPAPSVLGLPLTSAAAARFDLLPPHARVRLIVERFVPAGGGADESIASFFARRFGRATVELVAQPLLGGIHAGDTRHLSTRSLFPNLLEAEASGGVLRSLRKRPSPTGGAFNALSGGMETLPAAIARSLPRESVRYGAEVQAVTATQEGWRVDAASGPERASAVVFATPLPVTARLLKTVDSEAAIVCSTIPHASSVSVAIAWPRAAIAHPLRGSGFVVARGTPGFRVTACTWVSSKWEGRAPSGHALLRAFIGGVRDPHAVDLADDDLAAIATRDLGQVLGIGAPPELARVYRWRDASPQLNVGHEARVGRIDEQLRHHRGVFITGRGLRAVGIPDCISDARSAAAAAADYLRSVRL